MLLLRSVQRIINRLETYISTCAGVAYNLALSVPHDMKFSDSHFLLHGAAILRNEIVVWQEPPFYSSLAQLAARFSPGLVRRFTEMIYPSAMAGMEPETVRQLNVNSLLEARFLPVYRDALHGRKLDCIFLSASNGGSLHLADVMRVPILGSGLNLFMKRRANPDDVRGFVDFGMNIASDFFHSNEHLEVVLHIDPVHDRMNLPTLHHFRVKFWLPKAYRAFIQEHLKEGGQIVVFDVQEPWLHYEIGQRFYLQIGGLDDITPYEYISGSPRLDDWLEGIGAKHRGGWKLEGTSPKMRFDDEFGNSPRMVDEAREFAEERGYGFVHIRADRSHDLSALSTHVIHDAMERENFTPKGVLVEQYTQCAPLAVRRLALLPIWTYFLMRTSFNDAKRMLQRTFEKYVQEAELMIFLPTPGPLSAPTGDLVSYEEWKQLLDSFPARNRMYLVDGRLYPMDLASAITGPLKVLEMSKAEPDIPMKMTLDDIKEASKDFGIAYEER